MLFLASLTYVFGYLTWCVHANHRGLGLLPPLEGQYFLAGVIPGSLVAAAAAFARGVPTVRTLAKVSAKKQAARATMLASVALALAGYVLSDGLKRHTLTGFALFFAGCAGTAVGYYLEARAGWKWGPRVYLPTFALVTAWAYAILLFPLIPNAFGGPRVRCVFLDLKKEDIGSALVESLGAPRDTTTSSVRRAGPVWLHFEGDPYILISRTLEGDHAAVIQIRESSVMAVAPGVGCADRR